jgi:glutaredoxin
MQLTTRAALPWMLTLLACVALPVHAQFKVVAPDGSVTYTDRPGTDINARVTNLGRNGSIQSVEASLPPELRSVTQRYPVTLFTSSDCPPCDAGRKLLQARGVPFAERRVSTEEDALALDKAVGGRTVPTLTIGTQPLRGYAESDWTAYLDAAGYPREGRLPRTWQAPAVQPVAERAAAAKAPAAASAPATTPVTASVPAPAAAASGLRF